MFGFLSPLNYSDEYRSIYSRCCQHHRSQYGLFSLPFLSYEAVFLYLFWIDATLQDAELLPAQRCCRLRRLSESIALNDLEVGEFCSALSMLLAGTKLDDDVRDASSIRARFVRSVLGKRLRHGRDYFEHLSPEFSEVLEDLISAHLELETEAGRCSIYEYTRPTAAAFGHVFRQFAHLPDMGEWEHVLHEMGSQIGTALIAFDCAADWHRDQKNLEFNPLTNWQEVEASVIYARESLGQAKKSSEKFFGKTSRTASLLGSVRESIVVRDRNGCDPIRQLSVPGRVATVGGLSSVLVGSSDSDSDCGAICCALVCCGIAAGACKGQVIGSSSVETDCCGNKKVVHRKAGPCD